MHTVKIYKLKIYLGNQIVENFRFCSIENCAVI